MPSLLTNSLIRSKPASEDKSPPSKFILICLLAWIEAALEDGVEIHEPDSLEDYSGQFKLRIPRSLHRSLAEHSQREGISMNQYCVYLLSRNDAVFSK